MEIELDFLTAQVAIAFILIMARFLALITNAPIFSRRDIPAIVKIGFALSFTLMVYPHVSELSQNLMPTNMWALCLAILREIVIGTALGFITSLLFDAIASMGQILGTQMAQSAANVFDPTTNTTLNPTALFYVTVSLMIFLIFDGHYNMFAMLMKTFEILPLGSNSIDLASMAENMVSIFSLIFIVSVKFMLPLIGALFLGDVIIAIVAKILPQSNMFFLMMPTKLILGMFLISIALAAHIANVDQYHSSTFIENFDSLFLVQ